MPRAFIKGIAKQSSKREGLDAPSFYKRYCEAIIQRWYGLQVVRLAKQDVPVNAQKQGVPVNALKQDVPVNTIVRGSLPRSFYLPIFQLYGIFICELLKFRKEFDKEHIWTKSRA